MIDKLNRRARMTLVAAVAIACLAAAAWFFERRPGEIVGSARVIDGDSIVVAGIEIRIYGIDAPEYRQTCVRSGRPWRCGLTATDAMRTLVAGREIRCRPREQDRYGRTVAICYAGGLDLGAAMVKGGHAVSYGAYQADERDARDARRGIWSSSFEMPAAWRAHHRRSHH
jgi:endonuclease YncB( thermonuclease family)